jgi:hypothetical protein
VWEEGVEKGVGWASVKGQKFQGFRNFWISGFSEISGFQGWGRGGWIIVKGQKFLDFWISGISGFQEFLDLRNFINFWISGWRKGWGGLVSKVRKFWISGSERLYSRSLFPSEIGFSFV